MGLIAKAVDKLDSKEEPVAAPEAPPQPEEEKPKSKKRLLLLAAPLVLAVVASVVGYFLFLKPADQTPPKITRRSISARNKMARPSPQEAGKSQDGKTPQAQTEVESQAAEKAAVDGPVASKPATKMPAAPKSKEKSTADEVGATVREKQEPNPQAQAEPKTTAPSSQAAVSSQTPKIMSEEKKLDQVVPAVEDHQEQVLAPEDEELPQITQKLLPRLEQEMQTLGPPFSQPEDDREVSELPEIASLPPATPAENDLQDLEEVEQEIGLSESDEFPFEQTAPIHPSEPVGMMTPGALKVSERSESRAESYYKKGFSYQQQGELAKTIDAYKRALSYNPDHLQANMNLATAYLQAGRFKQAEQILVYLYASRPKDSRILYNFGVLLYQTGEHSSAENKLKKLLEMDPFHLEANLLLSTIYEEEGEMDQAIEACMKAYQINSAHPLVLYRLGRVWDLAGDPSQASIYYRQFLSCRSEKEQELESAVRDRLKYLGTRKEE